ncbi:MAG: hypothetical protein FJ399_06960 [Verrucomicrobia bacterium]|nr:hypothetical protein [Verrucomicrobiota bacterium]
MSIDRNPPTRRKFIAQSAATWAALSAASLPTPALSAGRERIRVGVIGGGGKAGGRAKSGVNPMVQEHVDLIRSIREGRPLSEAREMAEATLTAIMGRISAYTGQIVRWADLTGNKSSPWFNRQLSPTPEDFETGKVTAPRAGVIPLPGAAA